MTALLEIACRHADARALIPGVSIVRAPSRSGYMHAITRPMACLVLQGESHVTIGVQKLALRGGDSLLVAADMPVASQITLASRSEPYVALLVELDIGLIEQLAPHMGRVLMSDPARVQAGPTEEAVAGAALKLLRLLDRPDTAVVQARLMLDLHYCLLAGGGGAAIRQLGWPDSHVRRISAAVAAIREALPEAVSLERLASVAGMSRMTFRNRFRGVTSLSPPLFRRQLRLIEARRLMVTDGASATYASRATGYTSLAHFGRDYTRMFGSPPATEARTERSRAENAA